MLDQIIDHQWLTHPRRLRLLGCRTRRVTTWSSTHVRRREAPLRFQHAAPADPPGRRQAQPFSLADLVAPQSAGVADYVGAFAVTSGASRPTTLAKRYEKDLDDYNAIMVKALADRLAEAFAEHTHARARKEWGYGQDENLTNEDLIGEKYRGIRPAYGYPACPDHSEKPRLFELLDAPAVGIHLTESFAMVPGASVSGLLFSHPDARYFTVGRIGRDQVEDYAARKGMDVLEAERWLSPNLGYDPDA